MGSKRGGKNVIPTGDKVPASTTQDDEAEELISEEEYRKKFEPVAPWKRKNIPDYGPLHDQQHAVIFIAIGIAATLFYELTRCVYIAVLLCISARGLCVDWVALLRVTVTATSTRSTACSRTSRSGSRFGSACSHACHRRSQTRRSRRARSSSSSDSSTGSRRKRTKWTSDQRHPSIALVQCM